MKPRIGLLLAVLVLLPGGCTLPKWPVLPRSSPTAQTTPTSIFPGLNWNDRSVFRDGLVPADRAILDSLSGASIYFIDLVIADDMNRVSGIEEIQYTNRSDITLDKIDLHLYPNLLGGRSEVSAVKVNDQPVTPAYNLNNSLLQIPLSNPLPTGQSAVIHITFDVTVPTTTDTSYGILAYTQGVLSLAHVYPTVAVYGQDGWDTELPAPWGDVLNNQASFYVVRVSAPARLTIVATGREIQRQVNGDSQQVTFADGPARDFYLAASPDYVKTSRTSGDVTVNSYAPRGDETQSALALDTAAAALQDFSQRYTLYPYTEFDIVAIPTQALGVEYPGLVAILQDIYSPRASNDNEARQTIEFTVAHETAHQWFYNLVGNNQLDQPWLDESLAQFATWQYYTDRYGAAAGQTFKTQDLQGNWASIQDADIPIGKPVRAYNEGQYLGIIYGRGALFFMALEQQMGEKTFDAFLREYAVTYSWGIATTDGLKQVAEKGCGCDLTPMFQEWVTP